MLQFFKKIRQQLLNENKLKKYFLYAIGEIILVVIGILIALQINNWNNRRIEKQDEIVSYESIKQQISEDKNALLASKKLNNQLFNQYVYANQIISTNDYSKMDTLAYLSMQLSRYSDFDRSGNIYETLINSGDLKLLKNKEIPNRLQNLEMAYNRINKLEDINWEIIIEELSPELKGVIKYANMQVIQPEKLFSTELQNFIIESIFLNRGKEEAYNKAIDEIQAIIKLIHTELESYQ